MIIKKLSLITFYTLLVNLSVFSQDGFTVKDFKMSVAGTSTLHDWESAVTKLDATGSLDFSGTQLNGIYSLKVNIPAKGIVSTKGKIMDNKTYEALKADKYPKITFLLDITAVNGSRIQATGRLSIAGKTQTVSLSATGKVDNTGNITFQGSQYKDG